MEKSLFAIALLSLAAIASFAPSAWAQHSVEYGLNLSLGKDGFFEHYETGENPGAAVEHAIEQPGYGRIAGVANVGFGVNKARIDLTGTNAASPLLGDVGFASSAYFDSFTFDDPKLNGQHGFFEATLFVAGSGHTNLSPSFVNSPDTMFDAFWHAVINVTVDGIDDPENGPIQSALYEGEWFKDFDSNQLEYFGDELNTYQQTKTFEFIYGQPVDVETFLQVVTFFDNQFSEVQGTLDTSIDLGNSAYWGGIRNLRDASGSLVTDAAYSSSSGFDYRLDASVPEPAMMSAICLAMIALRRKWRHAR